MKGLIWKDIQLIKNNSKALLIFALGAGLLIFSGGVEEITGAVAYFTMMCGMLVISTLTYDDIDKSDAFLMTLPISREIYTMEKYVFAFLMTFAGWFVSYVLTVISSFFIQDKSDFLELTGVLLAILFVIYFLIVIMIPLQLKFGSANSRIVIFGFVIVVFAGGFILKTIAQKMHMDLDGMENLFTQKINEVAQNVNIFWMLLAGFALELAVIYISYLFSKHIIKAREY